MVVQTQGVIHDAARGQPGTPGFDHLDDTEMIRHGPERAVGFRHGPPPHGAHVQDKAVGDPFQLAASRQGEDHLEDILARLAADADAATQPNPHQAVLVQPGVRLPRRRPGNPRLAGRRARQDGNVVLSS